MAPLLRRPKAEMSPHPLDTAACIGVAIGEYVVMTVALCSRVTEVLGHGV
jgi:hypothetical protein